MFLRSYLEIAGSQQAFPEDGVGTRYFDAYYDLNGDGQPEAIVYVAGRAFCGSGGCSLLILAAEGASYRVVTRTTVTRAPIRVLARTSHGWRSIGVWVQGGGIQPGYEAELRFDGKRYPSNPSVAPTRRLPAGVPGETVLPRVSIMEGKLLD